MGVQTPSPILKEEKLKRQARIQLVVSKAPALTPVELARTPLMNPYGNGYSAESRIEGEEGSAVSQQDSSSDSIEHPKHAQNPKGKR